MTSPHSFHCPSGEAGFKRAGFTLLEILAVITVLGVLFAVLIPRLKSAQTEAYSVQCMGNLGEIGRVMSAYAADNSGRMVPYASAPANAVTPSIYWVGLLAPYAPPPLDKTYSNSRIFMCPSVDTSKRVVTNPLNGYTDYTLAGLNGILFGVCNPTTGASRFSMAWCDRAPSLATIPKLSHVMMVSDVNMYFMWSTPDMGDSAKQNWRHNNGINCLFGDGHVQRRKRTDVPTDPTDVFWNGGNPTPVTQ